METGIISTSAATFSVQPYLLLNAPPYDRGA